MTTAIISERRTITLSSFVVHPWIETRENWRRSSEGLAVFAFHLEFWPGDWRFSIFASVARLNVSIGWFEIADRSYDDADDDEADDDTENNEDDGACPVCGAMEVEA
jgi:hypothetical protein